MPLQKIELQDFRELEVTGPMQDDNVSFASALISTWHNLADRNQGLNRSWKHE